MQRELRDLAKPSPDAPEKPPVDMKKLFVRVGRRPRRSSGSSRASPPAGRIIPLVRRRRAHGRGRRRAVVWLIRYVNKSRELGALLRSASQTEEGRKDALKKLETDFKKGDVQAVDRARPARDAGRPAQGAGDARVGRSRASRWCPSPIRSAARAPRSTCSSARSRRRARSSTRWSSASSRTPKTRAMFAAVAGEAWGRTGQAKKGVELLELYNPEDPELRRDARADVARARLRVRRGRAT